MQRNIQRKSYYNNEDPQDCPIHTVDFADEEFNYEY